MDPLAKENADEPAFPIMLQPDRDGEAVVKTGLTKRELIAAVLMAGNCANSAYDHVKDARCANWAVSGADALLQELREHEPGEEER